MNSRLPRWSMRKRVSEWPWAYSGSTLGGYSVIANMLLKGMPCPVLRY